MCILFWKLFTTVGFTCAVLSHMGQSQVLDMLSIFKPQEFTYMSVYECPVGSDFTYACPSTKVPDKNLVCIHQSWVCDEDPDCPEGEDEDTSENGPCHHTIQACLDSSQFQCTDETRLCIPKNWMCDGDLDCDDGSDEDEGQCPHVHNLIPCSPNELQCMGSHSCIPLSKVCDDVYDCDSSSDEASCDNNNCADVDCDVGTCVETTDGARCSCPDGQYFDNSTNTCSNLNECEYDQYCDQDCTDQDPGYQCSCLTGYNLVNNTHCAAINEPEGTEPTILIANFWDLRHLSIQGQPLDPAFIRVDKKIETIDFDHREQKIFWIGYDGNTGQSSLKSASLVDGTNDVIDVQVQLRAVINFAYDWVRKNFYFVDNILQRVSVCNQDGQLCSIVLGREETTVGELSNPRSIALSPSEGYLFVSDWSVNTSRIIRSSLSGGDVKLLVHRKIIKPLGLAIDHANKHLYWSDMDLNTIERIDFDGNKDFRRIIAIGMKAEYIHSMAVFENYLYVSDRHENQLVKHHRYDYSIAPVTLQGNFSRPAMLHVYHRQAQPDFTGDPCTESCGENSICTVEPGNKGLNKICLCAAGYADNNGKCEAHASCDDVCTDPQCGYIPEHCSLAACQANMSFCVTYKQCLPSSWWCDGKEDCPKGDDEGLYCTYAECHPTQFQCMSGKCIDMTYQCDGQFDCPDKSDEMNCESMGCDYEHLFLCTDEPAGSPNQCIPKVFVCDGHWDCSNGSDEANCNITTVLSDCGTNEFTCRNGECIPMPWKCDGDVDCGDETDEDPDVCSVTKNKCRHDEKSCDSNNKCIPNIWFCDGEPDCPDRSDESVKNCNDTIFHCPYPQFSCHVNNTQRCFPPEKRCDNITDCDDKSDENGQCDKNLCSSNPCPDHQVCYNSPLGYVCMCKEGEKVYPNKTCIPAIPADQLCKQWGVCSQDCELDDTTAKGYQCTCKNGFFLEPDDFTCKPLESDPVYVLFSNRHELRRVDVVLKNAISLVSGLRNTIALDFYYKNGQPVLFWTDVMEDKIYRGTMMGNALINVEAIVSSGLATTEGIAVDWIAENIYWVESSLDQIEVAKVDGTNRTTLIAGNMSSPRAIAVDPISGYLFWTDWEGEDPRIERSTMSGEDRQIILNIDYSQGGGWPNGLTIDFDVQRVYWIDAKSESIHTVDYNGQDHHLVLKSHPEMSHPFAMSLFGNYVYWTDWRSNSVVRAQKFNGSNVETVQKTITQPFDLQIIHPKRHPMRDNPCAVNNGGCEALCLINTDGKVGCRCPHRKKLGVNGTCVEDKKFLLFVKNHEIRGVDIDQAHFNVIPVITIPHVDKPTAIDYDVNSDMLYWADKGLNVINRANFSASVETLIDKGLSNPEGLAIDWLSGNMYFSSYDTVQNTGSISVARLSGTFRTELIKENITWPQSIALHPTKGYLYFTDVYGDPGSHKLFRANMDGTEPNVLLKNLSNPTSLSVDLMGDRIYFINSGDHTIHCYDLNGNHGPDGPIIKINNIVTPEALTVHEDAIYISANEKIFSVSKTGTKHGSVMRDETPDINALLLYDISTRSQVPDSANVCHGKHNCSQLCLPQGGGRNMSMCKCTAGFDLDVTDNISCIGILSFLLYAKETEIRGQMFFPESIHEALPPISNIQSASAIDFHAASDMIYWVDTKANTISRIRRDLSGREVIVRDGLNSVEGLAIDWISEKIYWTDAGHSTIEMARLNGSDRYVIASGDMEKPRSIVVDPKQGYIYWSDWGTEPRIERANLDGSNRVQFIYNNISKPWGLTMDYERYFLFWCDAGKKTIEMKQLYPDAPPVVLVEASDTFRMDPISLTYFNGYVYWIDGGLNGSAIYKVSIQTKQTQLIRANRGKGLKDIKAFDASIQDGTNECQNNNGGCEKLCFYLGNNNVKCACPFGKLNDDGKTCDDYTGFLVYSKVTGIESINLHNTSNKNDPIPPIRNETTIRNVIGLSFDYNNDLLFYSDIVRGDLQAYERKSRKSWVVVDGIGSAEGLAFVKGDLYWTSYTNSCISKINVQDSRYNKSVKPEVVVQMSKLDHPRAIVVDACWELIYWTNWNNEKPRIQRSNLQGSNVTNVIVEDILTPNGLTIDHLAKKLYWSDARLDKIERCNMDGTNRQVIITDIPQHSFGLVIYGEYLFWTDWMLRAVIRANKYDGTGIVWLRKNLERQPMGIIAFANDSADCTLNACHDNKHGCQDKCFTTEYGEPFCQCRYGRLKTDGKTCQSVTDCAGAQFDAFPCLSGLCIAFEKSCDSVIDCVDGSDESPITCKNRTCKDTMFSCNNRTQGQCIASSKRCDGHIDCHDGSDENPVFCDCTNGIKCGDGKCVSKKQACDGNRDCDDGLDEENCTACRSNQFMCLDSKFCIPSSHKCDNKRDCGDGSDEADCPHSECGEGLFRCNNGDCIDKQWRCDRDEDCSDKSDELDCTYNCSDGQFACGDHTCISLHFVCDGNADCADLLDENNCSSSCSKDQYTCNNGQCIDNSWKCDQEYDCIDASDEGPENGCPRYPCQGMMFQCANYQCIDRDFVCDGEEDCMDGSDEPEGCDNVDCDFMCKNSTCITSDKVCDGVYDCPDREDELCPAQGCGDDEFTCVGSGVCLNESKVCDGVIHCQDHSDESPLCDVDECSIMYACDQNCEDKKLGYKCSCDPGYSLKADNKSCEGTSC